MSATRCVHAICFPILVVSVIAAVGIGLTLIWSEPNPEHLDRWMQSAITLAAGSGFLMSATRVAVTKHG